jgi:hypothetical protein
LESNWRYNVADLGMSLSSWELAARVAGTPFSLWIVQVNNNPGNYEIWHVPAPMQLPVHVATVAIPTTHPHFPYGAPVLPD